VKCTLGVEVDSGSPCGVHISGMIYMKVFSLEGFYCETSVGSFPAIFHSCNQVLRLAVKLNNSQLSD